MVNNLKIKPPEGENPSDKDRLIANGPLYPLAEVQEIADSANTINLVTKKCRNDVENLGWSTDNVGELIKELRDAHYRNSEWCLSGTHWFACDAYVIRRKEFFELTHTYYDCEYYVKLSISVNGLVLLAVSCHL